ncbi:MAG: hypothetical protein IJ681_10850 [Bacteroidales bacterium]|nr:hypothetical protein [Bacteroidales bacterium]
MNVQDFENQIAFCQQFNNNTDDITVHQLHTFLDEYYKNLLHLKRDLTIAAYSKTQSNKYDFLSETLLNNCVKSMLNMQYKGLYSEENEHITSVLIDNCISALKGIAVSFNKLLSNRRGVTFNTNDEHKQKVITLKETALNVQ